jgi:hypothetical protein
MVFRTALCLEWFNYIINQTYVKDASANLINILLLSLREPNTSSEKQRRLMDFIPKVLFFNGDSSFIK